MPTKGRAQNPGEEHAPKPTASAPGLRPPEVASPLLLLRQVVRQRLYVDTF